MLTENLWRALEREIVSAFALERRLETARPSFEANATHLLSRIDFELGYAAYIWMNPRLFSNVKLCLAIHRLSKARPVEHVRTRTPHLDAFLSFVEADVHFIQ